MPTGSLLRKPCRPPLPVLLVLGLLLLPMAGADVAAAQDSEAGQEGPCGSELHRQLDFWVGSWDVFVDGELAGHNRIERALSGCALIERWTSAAGSSGMSFNWIDRSTQADDPRWRQLWIDAGGGTLDYTRGQYEDGAMTFEGDMVDADGDRRIERLVFRDVAPDTVRQTFLRSTDDGASWETTWEGVYVRAESEAARYEREAQAVLDDLLEQTAPHAEVLLLGTFHFDDAGLDAYQPEHELDILGEARQGEIADLVGRLAEWAPTQVAVEVRRPRQEALQRDYDAWRAGDFALTANETHQLGFRLAGELGHDAVHAVDADGIPRDPELPDPAAWARQNGQGWLADPSVFDAFMEIPAMLDERKTRETIRETLLFMNAPTFLEGSHGVYVSGAAMVGNGQEYPGPDGFLTHWMNRNMRILANIRQLARTGEERVVVIIGQGHVALLRHAILASPELELVEVHDVLADG